MPAVDLVDETFVVASPGVLAAAFADPAQWAWWWPTLTLRLDEDRGVEGARWFVTGDFTGTSEVWLEAYRDGTIVHFYLRVDPRGVPVDTPRRRRWAERTERRHAVAFKRRLGELKDGLEAGRPPGEGASFSAAGMASAGSNRR